MKTLNKKDDSQVSKAMSSSLLTTTISTLTSTGRVLDYTGDPYDECGSYFRPDYEPVRIQDDL